MLGLDPPPPLHRGRQVLVRSWRCCYVVSGVYPAGAAPLAGRANYATLGVGRVLATVTVLGDPYQTTGRIYWPGAFVGLAD